MAGSDKKTESAQQQATSTNTIDPAELKLLQDNYSGAQTRANSLTPYSGQLTAGFTPTQTQAQGILSGIGTDPRYAAANNNAIGSVQGILGNTYNSQITPKTVTPANISAPTFDPAQISSQAPVSFNPVAAPTPVNSNPVTAGLLAKTDLSPYLNPYTKDVIDTTVSANERARQIAGVSDAQHATAAGAFGGSRSGVAASLTNEAYDRNSLAALAGLNSDNYTQAVAGATGDINRTLGADQFNSGQKFAADQYNSGQSLAANEFNSNGIFGADQFNANLGQAANIYNANNQQAGGIVNATQGYNAQAANQAAGINTGEYNATNDQNAQQSTINNALASAGLQLNAAGQIVSLNNTALGASAAQAGILSSVGDQQQAQQQQELTDAYNAWSQGQQLTIAQQNLLNSALGLIPNQQTTTSSGTSSGTSTTTKNPGLVDILSALGSAAQGGASMAAKSDARAKSDIETVGYDDKGRRWVSFRYNWEKPGSVNYGVIAQEILKSDPNAVTVGDDGEYWVDYSKLLAVN